MGDDGGGSRTNTQTSNVSEIPAEAKPLANALAELGMKNIRAYGTTDTDYDTGYRTELGKMAGGFYLDPATNAALQKQEAAIDTSSQEAFRRALADSQRAAAQAGGLLGVKSRVAANEAARRVAADATKAKADLEAANYAAQQAAQRTALEKRYSLYRQPLTDALTALSILRGTSGVAETRSTTSGDAGGKF
jgi:hypothetical protein